MARWQEKRKRNSYESANVLLCQSRIHAIGIYTEFTLRNNGKGSGGGRKRIENSVIKEVRSKYFSTGIVEENNIVDCTVGLVSLVNLQFSYCGGG